MTTKLSQKRVKGGDPSYSNLEEELRARQFGTGEGYTVPSGGIPKADLSEHLRTLLTNVEKSMLIDADGVTIANLVPELEEQILKIKDMYVKPADGIELADLELSIQQRLTDFANFYIYPTGGIPRVDMDSNIQNLLKLAESAYQKPSDGIPYIALDEDIQSKIEDALSRYIKPEYGIPDSDLEEDYALSTDLIPFQEHTNNEDIHITHHDKLMGIGKYQHELIDKMLDSHDLSIEAVVKELGKAREEFGSIGDRMNSLLGLNSVYSVSTEKEWLSGQMKDLQVNNEGFVGLTYNPDVPIMKLYDISEDDFFKEEKRIGHLYFESNSRVNLGSKPWLYTTDRRSQVGVRLDINVYADVSGVYEFATQFSGRMRLQVGSKLLYDTNNIVGQVDAYTRRGQVELEAGRLYRLVFEGWYQFEGDRIFGISWQRPGTISHVEILPKYFNSSGYMVKEGTYVSEIIDMKDTNISKWVFELDASENRYENDILVEIQRSDDNITWSPWHEILDNGEINLTPTRFCRVRITVYQHLEFYSPVVKGFKIRFISSMNNEIMSEIIGARDRYMSIAQRLKLIEESILRLAEFDELQDQNSIHPEYFASVRLAEQEVNMLKLMLIEAERQKKVINFGEAVADSFGTAEFIDDEKSAKYEVVNESVRTLDSNLRLAGEQEWAQWELDRLDYYDNAIRLAYSTSNALAQVIAFNNWYLWSTRDSARLAGNYQAYIAQPFYTSKDVNVLTRLQLQAHSVSNHPGATIMICKTMGTSDRPDVDNPLWSISLGYSYSTSALNYTGLRIPVNELTKYWIVLRRDTVRDHTGYSRWYLGTNNTNINARLRGTNPVSQNLFVRYTADANGQTGWLTDSSYFLTFHIDEGSAFETAGTGSRIIDYQKQNNFERIVIDADESVDGLITFSYQSSDDTHAWSEENTDIAMIPKKRFLKINMSMQKASVGTGSPLLKQIDIFSKHQDSELVSKPVIAESVPTHAIMTASKDPSIRFEVSRDDGVSWKPIVENAHTQLDDIQPGTHLRIKAIFSGDEPEHWLHNWAWSAITFKDITQQNITALYEEYIAEDNQQVFKLKDRYVTGNHSLQVYLNGIRQSISKDYIEVDNYTVMFHEQLLGGIDADRVTFVVAAGVYDMHDAFIKSEIDFVKERVDHLNVSHSKTHVYNDKDELIATVFNHESYIQRIDYEYDSNGRKSKETKTTKNYVEVIEYTYNERGFLVEETITINEVTN